MEISKLLLATDGSANARRALETAAGLATPTGASVSLIHAITDGPVANELLEWARLEHGVDTRADTQPATAHSPGFGRLGVPHHTNTTQITRRARSALGEAILTDASRTLANLGVTVANTYMEEGDPAEVIAEATRTEAPSITVLGTRGMGPVRGVMMGSVAHKVLGMHETPTLIVP